MPEAAAIVGSFQKGWDSRILPMPAAAAPPSPGRASLCGCPHPPHPPSYLRWCLGTRCATPSCSPPSTRKTSRPPRPSTRRPWACGAARTRGGVAVVAHAEREGPRQSGRLGQGRFLGEGGRRSGTGGERNVRGVRAGIASGFSRCGGLPTARGWIFMIDPACTSM